MKMDSKKGGVKNTIRFKSKLTQIGSWVIIRLDSRSSGNLTTRGLAMVVGTINGYKFQTALEPDGKGSHWFKVDDSLIDSIGAKVGDTVELEITQTKEWSEPKIPTDLKSTLVSDSKAYSIWKDITPFARWEWIRWISATKNEKTRVRRIEVARSKLNSGHRRPCCFNSNQCTVPYVSNNGVLLETN